MSGIGQTAADIARYVLAFELLMGGQSRITSRLTPEVRRIALADAEGYKRHLPFIPGGTAVQHSRNMGGFLLAAGVLLLVPSAFRQVRVLGVGLGGAMVAMFGYAQARMGLSPWLPIFNAGLVGTVVCAEFLV